MLFNTVSMYFHIVLNSDARATCKRMAEYVFARNISSTKKEYEIDFEREGES
jgi:hypothetical protein